jgi:hypothetical protein
LDPSVQHPDLVTRRTDVGEHQDRVVGDLVGLAVRRGLGERHAHELGLRSVDEVPEDPATSAGAQAVSALAAEPAPAARRDARDEDSIAGADRRDARPDLLDRADGFVTQDPTFAHVGYVPLEDVEIGSADRDGVDADDGIRGVHDRWVRNLFPSLLTWSVVHDRLHRRHLPFTRSGSRGPRVPSWSISTSM